VTNSAPNIGARSLDSMNAFAFYPSEVMQQQQQRGERPKNARRCRRCVACALILILEFRLVTPERPQQPYSRAWWRQ
jgi:hypothetical protein